MPTFLHSAKLEINEITLYSWNLSSVQSLDRLGRQGDMRDHSAEIFFQCFPQEALVSSSGKVKDVVHPAFPALTTASPMFQGALKDGFVEAVMACDMPEPCKFPSLDSCQKRFLGTHKAADPALHPVFGPVQASSRSTSLLSPPSTSMTMEHRPS